MLPVCPATDVIIQKHPLFVKHIFLFFSEAFSLAFSVGFRHILCYNVYTYFQCCFEEVLYAQTVVFTIAAGL